MATIKTIFSLQDNMSSGLKNINKNLDSTSSKLGGISSKLLNFNMALQAFNAITGIIHSASNAIDSLVNSYQEQLENEVKLETVMHKRMNASQEDIQYIKQLASEQQKLGIYGDEMILKGAQELATFANQKEAIATLIPAMNNLVAQQYGYNASAEQMRNAATMMGKVLQGNVSGLSRLGYVFSEEEEQMLQTGDEMQRASVLAKILNDNVGEMNKALANTPTGAIKQASNAIGDFKERVGGALVSIKSSFEQIKASLLIYFEKPIMQAIDWIKNNLDKLVATLINVGTVAVTVGTIMAVAWAIANWPITLAIILIITLIRALDDATISSGNASDSMNEFGNACESAGKTFGQVAGTIAGLIGGLMNIIYNFVAIIFNAFSYVATFLTNVFVSPINSIASLFIDLAKLVLQVVGFIGGVIDWVFGTSIDETMNRAIDAMEQFKREKFGYGWSEAPTMNPKNVQGAFSYTVEGGRIGKDLGQQLDKTFANVKGMNMDKELALLSSIDTSLSGTLKVKDNSKEDINSNYRELLSDYALAKYNEGYMQKAFNPVINFGGVTIIESEDGENSMNNFVNKLNSAFNDYLNN